MIKFRTMIRPLVTLLILCSVIPAFSEVRRIPRWEETYKMEYAAHEELRARFPNLKISDVVDHFIPTKGLATHLKVVKWRDKDRFKAVYNYRVSFNDGSYSIVHHPAMIDVFIDEGDTIVYIFQKPKR